MYNEKSLFLNLSVFDDENIVLSVINFIKIPAPTIEFRSKGGLKFHYLYF